MIRLDLRKGITETDQYKAWKFPGGEIHFKLKTDKVLIKNTIDEEFQVIVRLNSSDDIMFMLIAIDTIKKEVLNPIIDLEIPYMPYQQADRDFGYFECFSLKTVANIINSLNLAKVTIYDPHSDVCTGLINRSRVIDNSAFIKMVLEDIINDNSWSPIDLNPKEKDIVIISTDAGSYKKINKLCEKLSFKGEIVTCSKSRNHETGEITTVVPEFDDTKLVLIIDDIALGSRTFFNIRKELKNEKVYLAVSHGIFNENVDKLELEFTKIFTTNSRRDESIGKNIEVFNIF